MYSDRSSLFQNKIVPPLVLRNVTNFQAHTFQRHTMATFSITSEKMLRSLPETLPHASSQQEQFRLSSLAALDRSIALLLLLGGMVLIVSGFLHSLHHPTCGVLRLLLGIAPAIAGGYHAYCLEAWRYEAHLSPTLLRWRCMALYLIAGTLAGTSLSVTCCG